VKFRPSLYLILIISMFLTIQGCQMRPPQPQLNPLQIEAMQTRTFNVDKRVAFNAVVTVFQNLGYIVSQANFNTGFITAQSPKNTNFFGNTNSVKTTAFITETYDHKSKIRINFVTNNMFSGNKGQVTVNDTAVENAQSYINAFNKIRQQIFVSTGMNPVSPNSKTPTQTQTQNQIPEVSIND